MNKQIGMMVGVLALLLLGTTAWAQGGQGRRGGGADGEGRQGRLLDRVAYGEIISISAEEIVIIPQIPEDMAQRIQDSGRDMPELPAQLSIMLSEDTKFVLDSGMASIADFQAGDQVVVTRDRDGNARSISDLASAQQFMQQRAGQRGNGDGQGRGFGQGGQRGPGGPGGEGGRGGRGGERRPPAMGSITAISADSITIAPMIPEEMKQRMQEHGRELPELPASITWSIDSETRYVTIEGRQDSNPFSVGDIVVVMGPPDDGSAKAIVSEEAAREHMQQRGGEGGPGGRQGGQGGKRKGGGGGGQR